MTFDDFRRDLKIHYGRLEQFEGKPVRRPREYDSVTSASVFVFVNKFVADGGDLQALFDATTAMFSANYGKLPDVPQLAKAAATIPKKVLPLDPGPDEAELIRGRDETGEGVQAILADLKSGKLRGKQAQKAVERRDPYPSDEEEQSHTPSPVVLAGSEVENDIRPSVLGGGAE